MRTLARRLDARPRSRHGRRPTRLESCAHRYDVANMPVDWAVKRRPEYTPSASFDPRSSMVIAGQYGKSCVA